MASESSESKSESESEEFNFDGESVDVSDEEFWKWKKANLKGEQCFWNKKTNVVCNKEGEEYNFMGLLKNKKLINESDVEESVKEWISNCGIKVTLIDDIDIDLDN